jgi:hypothetical protein
MEAAFKEGDEVVDSEGRVFIRGPIDKNDTVILGSLDGNRKLFTGRVSLQKGYIKKKRE